MDMKFEQYGTAASHEAILPMLETLDNVCRENAIVYSLGWGTLLGAIRHDGFIPWDDDADVMMDRENYEKFLRCWKDQGQYCLRRYLWTKRIMISGEQGERARYAVDIFVSDSCFDNAFQQKIKLTIVQGIQGMMHEKLDLRGKGFAEKAALTVTYLFGKLFPDYVKYKMLDSVSQWGNSKKQNISLNITGHSIPPRKNFPRIFMSQ